MAPVFFRSSCKKFLLLAVVLSILLPTCTKNIHSLSNAKYAFKSDHEKCSGVHVNGNYHRFISLNDSNSVDIDAVVLEKGPYYISTDTVNGMYFSAYGVLVDTGNYTFHLVGNGSPEKKDNTHLTLLSTDHTYCGVEIPVFDYADTINTSEYAWEFYDNGVYHHGHVDTSAYTQDYIFITLSFSGHESSNSNATFGLGLWTLEQLKPGTFTDSLSHSFGYIVDQQTVFSTYRKLSTVIIDSNNGGVIKGRFSWTGLNDEGVFHEIKDGKFYVKLYRVSD